MNQHPQQSDCSGRRDEKGYTLRPFDWEDKVVMWGCIATVAIVLLLVLFDVITP